MMTDEQIAKAIKDAREKLDEIDVALKEAEDAVETAMIALETAVHRLSDLRAKRESSRILDNIEKAAKQPKQTEFYS